MSFTRALGPIAGTGYEEIRCPNSAYAFVQVQNGAIDINLARGDSPQHSSYDTSDNTLLPGSGTLLGPFHAIRIKNHAPVSTPVPQVSIQAADEVPLGVNLSGGWTPSYAVIEPDGNIGANFSGHVHALGLDLDAAIGITAADDNRTRWISPDTGQVIGSSTSFDEGDLNRAYYGVDVSPTADAAAVFGINGGYARIEAYYNFDSGKNKVAAYAGVWGLTVLDQDNHSQFARADLSTGVPFSTTQVPAFAYLGDIDGAKWIVGLGGFALTFYSDNADAYDLGGLGHVIYKGRTYKPKVRMQPDGTILAKAFTTV